MSCIVFEFEISERIDHELSDPLSRELEHHLEICSRCRRVYEDLLSIKTTAAELEFLDPPRKVWTGIEKELQAEGLARGRWNWRFWEHLLPLRLGLAFKPALAGAMLILLIGLGSILVYKHQSEIRQTSVARETVALQNLEVAKKQYQKAIDALTEVSRKKLQGLDPMMARIFNDNLATMDFYLKECTEAVKSDPGNPLAQNYLLAAYQKKVELLETIVNSDLL